MQDSFSSVRNMLLWQIEQSIRQTDELESAIKKHGEVYGFPNEKDGKPDVWVYGKLSEKQVIVSTAMQGINSLRSKIKLTQADVNHDDFPSAIYRLIDVNKSIDSVRALWSSGFSVRAYRYIEKYRKSKSLIAKKARKKNKPSKEILEIDRSQYFYEHGHDQGWLKQAHRKFKLSTVTINNILNG